MFRLIRIRLVLSYAGIALLVTLALGAVLLVRLRTYYTGMEQDYLISNAKAISALAAPLLGNAVPKDVQEAQVGNLAFLSQTRVRILDAQMNLLADSGSWQTPQIGMGVMRTTRVQIPAEGSTPEGPSSVIVLQKRSGQVSAFPVPSDHNGPITAEASGGGTSDVLYFSAPVPVSNGVYGLYLSNTSTLSSPRSNQIAQVPIRNSSGTLIGFVELSEGLAYGREILQSVASGLAVAGGLAILLAIAAGWVTSQRFTAPLSNLTVATQQMSRGDLSVRVGEAKRSDEFGILGKSFNQMAGQIEETIQTLRRFLADAAHELQTPLTALRTNLELARSEENNPDTENHIQQALVQMDRLQHLIQDLLSLSRLESASRPEEFQPVNLNELVQKISEPFAARADQAGQKFELDLPDRDLWTKGSAEYLGSALANLLDNAWKFTPSGGAIGVTADERAEDILITVSDTGIGILPDEMDMVFNRFHRGRNAASYPGSGLGLAIVRAIAHSHGGSVQAANNPQNGASFTLILPRIEGSG